MTTWSHYPRSPGEWLAIDGSAYAEPEVESSSSNRRFRLAENPDVAFWKNDIDEALRRAVSEAATLDDNHIICLLGSRTSPVREQQIAEICNGDALHSEPSPVEFSVAQKSFNLYWHFQHQSMPFDVIVTLKVSKGYYGHDADLGVWTPTLVANNEDICVSIEDSPFERYRSTNGNLSDHYMWSKYHSNESEEAREWIRLNTPDWFLDLTNIPIDDSGAFGTAETVKKIVQFMDDLIEIEYPLVNGQQVVELDLFRTNCDDEFIRELDDYLDGAPVSKEIVKHMTAIRDLLASRGVVMDTIDDSAVAQSLAGDTVALEARIKTTSAGRNSPAHALLFDLLTGTIHVECPLDDDTDQKTVEAIQEYEVARLKAELQGTLPEFNAFWENRNREVFVNRILDKMKERGVEFRAKK